jgi:hypothetical protein
LTEFEAKAADLREKIKEDTTALIKSAFNEMYTQLAHLKNSSNMEIPHERSSSVHHDSSLQQEINSLKSQLGRQVLLRPT